jgi:hypothetical protein
MTITYEAETYEARPYSPVEAATVVAARAVDAVKVYGKGEAEVRRSTVCPSTTSAQFATSGPVGSGSTRCTRSPV